MAAASITAEDVGVRFLFDHYQRAVTPPWHACAGAGRKPGASAAWGSRSGLAGGRADRPERVRKDHACCG